VNPFPQISARKRYSQYLLVAVLLLLLGDPEARADQAMLPVLARVGPWPVVSTLVGFRGGLWFCNSVKGRNHNSADVYRYDLRTGAVRYARHLFSQDCGDRGRGRRRTAGRRDDYRADRAIGLSRRSTVAAG
jgi:hypothetical protein